MKKLMFAAFVVAGAFTGAVAQELEDKAIAMNEVQPEPTEQVAEEATQNPTQSDFFEIKADALPQPVQKAVAADFEGATVAKAYKNEKGEFKLVLTTADRKQTTVYANAKGEWIKKQ
jgi:hypothetical protein